MCIKQHWGQQEVSSKHPFLSLWKLLNCYIWPAMGFTLTCEGRKEIENLYLVSFSYTSYRIMILANYVLNMSKVNCAWNWTSLPHHIFIILWDIRTWCPIFSPALINNKGIDVICTGEQGIRNPHGGKINTLNVPNYNFNIMIWIFIYRLSFYWCYI